MPIAKSGHLAKGDLFIEMDVDFPRPGSLDEKQLRSLSAILPRPAKEVLRPSVPPPNAELNAGGAPSTIQPFYEVTLEQVDMKAETTRAQQEEAQNAAEEEENDEGQGQQRAQPGCAQQ